MKKFLLSFLCFLMAVASGFAEEVTESFTFSNFTAGTQYAQNEEHKLSDAVTIYTTDCHFTTQLRIYSSATNNGYVVSDALPGNITKMTFNAGYKSDKLVVYGSNDGATWTEVGQVSVSSSYKDYSLNFTGSYTRFKLDVNGGNQIRLQKMSVTYEKSGAIEPPKETVATPVISPASKEFNEGETVNVSITTETEGATIHYTTNGDTPTAGSAVYSAPFEVNSTTTIKAIAVKDNYNNSEVASATYRMVDPNAVEKTGSISFASTAQRVSRNNNSQVWKNDNIVFTNNKNSSNTNVADYAPVRLYQNSEIIVECESGCISNIEFECTSSDYATALKNSIGNSTKSDNKVTVKLDGTSQTYTVAKLTAQVRLNALTVTYIDNGTTITPTLESPTITPESCLFDDQIEVSITAEEGATILYCLNGEEPNVEYTEPIVITENTTIKAKATKDECNDSEVSEATFTKVVVEDGQIVDKLTRELTGAKPDAYNDWSDKKVSSSAVYAGQSAGDNEAIQLRSSTDKGYSGIITTQSGGKVKKIIVEWNRETSQDRTLDIYGKNSAYSSPSDLYDSDKRGTKLGSIKKGTSELTIVGDYEYIGLRSSSGAMYLNSIRVVWEVEDDEPTSETWGSLYSPYAVEIPENVKVYIVTGENNGYVRLANITGAVPAMTGVIYNGEWNNKEIATSDVADVTGNLLKGSVNDEYVTEEAFVLAKVDGVVGFYKASMNQNEGDAFKNNGGKAYLPVGALTQSAQNAKALKFDFDTTGVEGVKVETAGKKVIYDLSGRRVNEMAQPGIYIVNGKKVMVK